MESQEKLAARDELTKDKYAFAVALIAAILAFGAFKEGLKGAHASIGFWTPDLLVLAIWFSLGLTASAYMFALSYIGRSAKLDITRWYRLSIGIGNLLYLAGILMPAIFALFWGGTELVRYLLAHVATVLDLNVHLPNDLSRRLSVVSGALAALPALTAAFTYARFKDRQRVSAELLDLARQRFVLMERAEKLYRQNFYNSAILESYKLIEVALRRAVVERGYYTLQYKPMKDLINVVKREKILSTVEINLLNDVRGLRNKASHSIAEFRKEDAKFAIETTSMLLAKVDKKEDIGIGLE